MKRTVVIGVLGTVLDFVGRGKDRWSRWRPTVSVCMQDDLRIDRFELLHDTHSQGLARQIGEDIGAVSPATAVRPHIMALRNPWDFEEVYGKLLDFARAYPFDTEAEDYLIHITTGTHVVQICLFLLTEARFLPGRLLQSSPDKASKAAAAGRVSTIDLDLSRYDSIATRFQAQVLEATSFLKSGISTRNAAFNRMIDRIEQVAIRSRAPILLQGPTGAGKSQLARRIYDLKRQQHQIAGPFVEVNCATLRGDGAMSALFGHRKGAFTGAASDRPGLLRTADKGMLFLDEIGELGPDEQAMILRAVEDRRFLPVGSDREVESDFQLIAGTNRDLGAEAAAGRFREDLFARLNLWTFELPGLAERREDIEPNLEFELDRFAARESTRATFNAEARRLYLAFATDAATPWTGNFRDLSASITRMATLAPGGRINADIVADEIAGLRRRWRGSASAQGDDGLVALLGEAGLANLDLFDRCQLATVVRVCRDSRSLSEAGRVLFGASRVSRKSVNDADRLRKYLARFDLTWDDCRKPA
ncbi:AAA domain-containing protein [Niveispirillum sp. SYP-B3756]|uniref:RNA repair transcriptional activator RtcR n=1 Tax=Niveispirillum sp. SYP-B3756 TaxID=2662178 RepID=UPI001292749F|nr:RNA repair transcriptional activator RtcR [Niveispirillum sp. SYP-B3756]MQP68105.1 AAA domain-containing protein [Niveispirillum sp. SYP-B3756]